MAGSFDMIREVSPVKDCWRLRVRVIRLWEMCSILDPLKPFAIDMVLIDVGGGKIQATIRKPMMKKFKNAIVEGEVYTMMNFAVIRSAGNYRAAKHEYKLLFSGKTRVFPTQSELIPMNGLSLMTTDDVTKTNEESNYLIDLVGLLTAVSVEKELVTEGRKTRMIQMELTDYKGKIHCTVFGNYVDTIKDLLTNGVSPMPILVVQFFKVRLYKGSVVIQNVNNASRILCNEDIPEVNDFRNGLAVNGIDPNVAMGELVIGNPVVPLADDFLKLYPRKTPEQLQMTEEEGTFIVLATIIAVLTEEQWRYGACKCHKAVTLDGGLYYCSNCCTHVCEVTPRFKLKVGVGHWDESVVFVLFDSDVAHLLGKSCKEIMAETKDLKSVEHPPDLKRLIGRALLFKVEKGAEYAFSYDDSFKVKKVCDDPDIISKFKDRWGIVTPKKLKFDPPFPILVEGEAVHDLCDSSSDDLDVLVANPVFLVSNGEASSSSGSQIQKASPIFAHHEEEDAGPGAMKKMKLNSVKIEKE
ncbi:hypothetical protein SESBI_19984 [Sesbania bispinosa]|nr:hypothetical protein SESBI_19984 [Sesbania bispinosa]